MRRGDRRGVAGATVWVLSAGILIGASLGIVAPQNSPRRELPVAAVTVATHRAATRLGSIETASATRDSGESAVAVSHPIAATSVLRRCTTGHLRVGLGRAEGAAGSTYVPLIFRNAGARRCTLHGYPGVSALTRRSGEQIGAAATWSSIGAHPRVVLAPGARARALLQIVDAANYPAPRCRPRAAAGLRVFPPGATVAAFVAVPHLRACSSLTVVVLSVRAVVPG